MFAGIAGGQQIEEVIVRFQIGQGVTGFATLGKNIDNQVFLGVLPGISGKGQDSMT